VDQDDNVETTAAGQIASLYYLHHETMDLLVNSMSSASDFKELLQIVCSAAEFDELPVSAFRGSVNTWSCLQRSPCRRDHRHTRCVAHRRLT
jgi:Sec63 Brl domain